MIKVPLTKSQRLAKSGLDARKFHKGWKDRHNPLFYFFTINYKASNEARKIFGFHPLYSRAMTIRIVNRQVKNIDVLAMGRYWLHVDYDAIMGYIMLDSTVSFKDLNKYYTIDEPGDVLRKEGNGYYLYYSKAKVLVSKGDKVYKDANGYTFIRQGDLTPRIIDGGQKLPIRGMAL